MNKKPRGTHPGNQFAKKPAHLKPNAQLNARCRLEDYNRWKKKAGKPGLTVWVNETLNEKAPKIF